MRKRRDSGLTILEMMIVVTIVGLLAGLTFPSVTSGLDSLRLRSSADSVAAFLSQAMAKVERSQGPVEITFFRNESRMELRSLDPKFQRSLKLEDGVSILHVHPEIPSDGETARSVVLLPGTIFPRLGVELVNRRGQRRMARIDPLTSMAVVEIPPENVNQEER